jgi:flagellar hook-length control protein FliK
LLQNGRILAALDFLPALALAVPPTVPAPGKDSSSSEATSPAASAFAAHMWQTDTPTAGPAQVMPFFGASGTSSKPAASASSDGAARAWQIEPLAPDLSGPGRRATPALEAGTGQISTIAEAMTGVSPIVLPGDGEATIVPQVPAASEHVEADVADRPETRQAEISVAAMQAQPERSILMPASEPLLPPALETLLPPSDAPAAGTENDPAKAPELQAGPASTGGTAAPPAITPGTGFPLARQARPPAALEPGLARAAKAGAGAPVLPAAPDSTERSGAIRPSEEQATPARGDPITRGAEAPRALASKDGADGADEAPGPDKATAQDASFGSQVRATDPSVRQPSSDAQPARSVQISGQPPNAVAFVQPAVGVSGEIAQLIASGPDGAHSAAPEPHPATRQVALQITKALDQDRTEIRIRLDPPDLGEVDIQLEFRDLRLSAAVSAERSDTLELLQRDSRSLVRALREAGLELADADLSFAHNGRDERPDAGAHAQRALHLPHPLPAAPPLRDLPLTLTGLDGFVSLSDGRMDLRV